MHENNPKYLNLFQIRQPIPAITSILHRASGTVLFVGLPFFLWLLSSSLNEQKSFDIYKTIIGHPITKFILLLFLWAFIHHALAGIRFLILDLHKGLNLKTARLTAKISLFSAPILAITIWGLLLW